MVILDNVSTILFRNKGFNTTIHSTPLHRQQQRLSWLFWLLFSSLFSFLRFSIQQGQLEPSSQQRRTASSVVPTASSPRYYCSYCCIPFRHLMLLVLSCQSIEAQGFIVISSSPTTKIEIRATTTTIRKISSATTKENIQHLSCSSMSSIPMSSSSSLRKAVPYVPPIWCKDILTNPPKHGRLLLGNFPTPLYRLECYTNTKRNNEQASTTSTNMSFFWNILNELNIHFYIKRDDVSGGVELGGNKIRKLEFLLADAIFNKYDSIVTIGGIQSNHCRATAAAARMIGLHPYLILRTTAPKNTVSNSGDNKNDIGFVGNLLIDRMVGSTIYTCTAGEYGRIGSTELIDRVCHYIQQTEGRRPYPIPVGGSNGLGSWGYINGVDELLQQWNHIMNDDEDTNDNNKSLDHIVFACGSGGTTAGICIGIALAFLYNRHQQQQDPPPMPKVHAICVCDDENYFYKHITEIVNEMGLRLSSVFQQNNDDDVTTTTTDTETFIRQHLILYQGKGLGYARNTPEELNFVLQFAHDTGIVLDPVYSGKALYNFMNVIQSNPESFRNTNVLFWHTGGALGLYDKCNELEQMLTSTVVSSNNKNDDNNDLAVPSDRNTIQPCHRLDIYGKGIGIDISRSSNR